MGVRVGALLIGSALAWPAALATAEPAPSASAGVAPNATAAPAPASVTPSPPASTTPPPPASAAPPPQAAPQRPLTPAAAAEQALASTDPERVATGLRQLAEIGEPTIIAPISARLREGLPPALAQRAIEVLVATGKPASAPVLLELLVHRRPAIRAAAAKGLGALRFRKAGPRLLELLDDGDADVRAAAIEALGYCGDHRAQEELFAALDRGERQAPLALARLVGVADVEKLVGYAKDRPFATVEPALRELLARESFPLAGKLRLIASVGELGTRSAQDFLRGSLDKLPDAGKPQMMRAVERAMQTARRIESEQAEPESASGSADAVPARPTGTGEGSER